MFNAELDLLLQRELESLSTQLDVDLAAPAAAVNALYQFTDATGLARLVNDGTLQAWHARLGWHDDVLAYGIALARSVLAAELAGCTDDLSRRFCRAVIENFNPRGTHFDYFAARLYQDTGASTWPGSGGPGYAVGLRTADLPTRSVAPDRPARMQLQPVIYAADEQHHIVRTLHAAYRVYFATAVERFGERAAQQMLVSCCDMFRHDIGTFLIRLRDPALVGEDEWIAIALARSDQCGNDGVLFDMVDNRFAPYVAIDITKPARDGARRLPLASIVVDSSLPPDTAAEGLRAFLGKCRAGPVVVRHAAVAPGP